MASQTDSADSGDSSLQAYYDAFDDADILESFHSIDEAATLENSLKAIQDSASRNFVLDANDEDAYVAFDLLPSTVSKLLNGDHAPPSYNRWINLWHPFNQRSVLKVLARHYDFSPRLLALMISDPRLPDRHSPTPPLSSTSQKSHWHPRKANVDCELGRGSDELTDLSSISSYDGLARGNLYRIVNDIWHYTSVDIGRNYVCFGFNSLLGTKDAGEDEGNGLLPHCIRVWTWLVVCSDSTVISINEDPFSYSNGTLDPFQQRVLRESRRNLTNVFRAFSKHEEDLRLIYRPMTVPKIRSRLGDTPEETAHRKQDAPGLLFYYLFENWHNSYTLVTRRKSRYGVELAELRAQMFQSPQLRHIHRLDSIGKELGVLKRHYSSYIRIIDRLLELQVATAASLHGSCVVSEASQISLETIRPVAVEKDSMPGVPFTSAARVRFRRLKDLIDLYALSEVEEYIKQKDSLVTLNFNLIAMKESVGMERLTRVTLLITKATILFLPVSLMSAYFSLNLAGTQYTVTQYWISFAVVLVISWAALFIFGVFSGSAQTAEFFAALCRGTQRIWRSTAELWA